LHKHSIEASCQAVQPRITETNDDDIIDDDEEAVATMRGGFGKGLNSNGMKYQSDWSKKVLMTCQNKTEDPLRMKIRESHISVPNKKPPNCVP
jgi:hypothetical protein